LFLDEPTTGLDPSGRNDLWGVIEQLVADGTTLLLTTQYLEEADRLADRIAVVDHGQVIAEGSAAELKSSIGSTIVRVEMGYADIDVDVMRSVLSDVGPVERGDQPRTVEVNVSDNGRSLLDVVRRLDAVGLEPESISVREPSLDDVFLTLTGRPVEERQQEGVAAA
jgi:ABC-2 type transport system ATP-binding protein